MSLPQVNDAESGIEFIEKIGSGGFSSLWRASVNGEEYAVKVLDQDKVNDSKIIKNFLYEGLALARLKHPALPKVIHVSRDEHSVFIVMEFIKGKTLDRVLADETVDEKFILHIAKSLSSALIEVHARGMIHRDIKPQNIMITEDRQVKLIDFGFAAEHDTDLGGGFAGTLSYCSPEQLGVLTRPLDARTDLFSVGVVLFEAITGQKPFDYPNIGELAKAFMQSTIPRPRALAKDVSQAFDGIICKLLEKDPDDRYQSASELESDLNSIEQLNQLNQEELKQRLSLVQLGIGSTQQTNLVGREKEVDKINENWELTKQGQGTTLVLVGEAGIGKTSILNHFLPQLLSDNGLLIKAKFSEQNPTPLFSLREAIDSFFVRLIGQNPDLYHQIIESLKTVLGNRQSIIHRFSSYLANICGFKDTGDDDEHSDSEAFYETLYQLFHCIAEQTAGTILFLDDIQWADDISLKFIERIASGLNNKKLSLVVTSRSATKIGVSGHDFEIQSVLKYEQENVTAFELSPLERPHIEEMVHHYLGSGAVDAFFIDHLEKQSHGNPFFIKVFLQSMIESGFMRYSWGHWVVDESELRSVELPKSAVGLLLNRAADLSELSQTTLAVGALVGNVIPVHLIKKVLETDSKHMNQAIMEAQKQDLLVRQEKDYYRFAHDRIREAYLSKIQEDELPSWHQKIAENLDQDSDMDSANVYDLGRHYALGILSNNPQRSFEICWQAGKKALEDFADDDAWLFLNKAQEAKEIGRLDVPYQFYWDLAEVCFREDKRELGHDNLLKALEICDERLERSRIYLRLSQYYMSGFEGDKIHETAVKALNEIGLSYPKGLGFDLIKTIAQWIFGLLAAKFKFLRYLVPRKSRRYYQTLAETYFVAGFGAYQELDAIGWVHLALRTRYPAAFLGACSERINLDLLYGGALGSMFLPKRGEPYVDRSIALAETFQDRQLIARTHFWKSIGIYSLSGQLSSSASVLHDWIMKRGDWFDVSEYYTAAGELAWNYAVRGYVHKAYEVLQAMDDRVESIEDPVMKEAARQHPLFSVKLIVLPHLSQKKEALAYIKYMNSIENQNDKIKRAIFTMDLILFHLEMQEYGTLAEQVLTDYREIETIPELTVFHFRYIYVGKAYLRLAQYEHESDPERKPERLKLLIQAHSQLMRTAAVMSLFRAHGFVIGGAIERIRGNIKKALRRLDKAEKLAVYNDDAWTQYEAVLQKAHLFKSLDKPTIVENKVKQAMALAAQHGWEQRMHRIRKEFDIGKMEFVVRNTASMSISSITKKEFILEEKIQALQAVSLAASSEFDPIKRAKIALDEIIRILGAERAYLFLENENTEELTFYAARDADKQDLAELGRISQTVVQKVRNTEEAVVITGSSDGAVIGSESIVAGDLRSIIAAPLLLENKLLGVIYLDNTLAKGLFSKEDIPTLLALGNHIAIAIDSAKKAQIEIQNKQLEKDLEVTGAVQNLLIPKEHTFVNEHLHLIGYFQPASVAGGDWFVFRNIENVGLLVILADVTGHGVGSAMVTASIAGSYHASANLLDIDKKGVEVIEPMMHQMRKNLVDTCGEMYGMTLVVQFFEYQSKKVHIWNAGAPPTVHLKQNEKSKKILLPSDPIWKESVNFGYKDVQLGSGDRMALFTDGIPEMVLPSKKQFGNGKWYRLLDESKPHVSDEGFQLIIDRLKEARGAEPLEDDITLIQVAMK